MAATKSGIIGLNQGLPWNYKDELDFFLQKVDGHIIIMGRKTYNENYFQNIDTEKIILSKNQNFKISNGIVFDDLDLLLQYLQNKKSDKKIFMIGGGEIYNLFLEKNLIDEFYLTEINKDYDGDSYINLDYLSKWQKDEIKKTQQYTIYLLKNQAHESN